MSEAIKLINNRTSRWMSSHLDLINDNMKKGKSYRDSFETGFVTNDMLLTINIYSGLDSFSDTVKKMADKIDSKIMDDISKLSAILKNISLIVLASSVIWIFGAIFSLVDKLGSGF
ncbi:type II secretion system F family protein [Enterovibrio coralii]|uniref:type II secretion system F family protein n=1 Tax=Enterovibrio coralii TaxID=294935 RepID=UPI0038BE0A77